MGVSFPGGSSVIVRFRTRRCVPLGPQGAEQPPSDCQSLQAHQKTLAVSHSLHCATSRETPASQALPPRLPARLIPRVRVFSPSHREHGPQGSQSSHSQSSAGPQGAVLHWPICCRTELQGCPPPLGCVRIVRLRTRWPPAQVALQTDHGFHDPSTQSMGPA